MGAFLHGRLVHTSRRQGAGSGWGIAVLAALHPGRVGHKCLGNREIYVDECVPERVIDVRGKPQGTYDLLCLDVKPPGRPYPTHTPPPAAAKYGRDDHEEMPPPLHASQGQRL